MTVSNDTGWRDAWEDELAASPAGRRSAARVGAQSRAVRYYGREATARIPKPEPELERSRPVPKPRLVTRRRAQWPVIAGVMVFAAVLLMVGVVSPILLSSRATDAESQVGRMENSQIELTAAIAALNSQISALSAPERVAQQAAQLGLAPADEVHYLQGAAAETEGDITVAGR